MGINELLSAETILFKKEWTHQDKPNCIHKHLLLITPTKLIHYKSATQVVVIRLAIIGKVHLCIHGSQLCVDLWNNHADYALLGGVSLIFDHTSAGIIDAQEVLTAIAKYML